MTIVVEVRNEESARDRLQQSTLEGSTLPCPLMIYSRGPVSDVHFIPAMSFAVLVCSKYKVFLSDVGACCIQTIGSIYAVTFYLQLFKGSVLSGNSWLCTRKHSFRWRCSTLRFCASWFSCCCWFLSKRVLWIADWFRSHGDGDHQSRGAVLILF